MNSKISTLALAFAALASRNDGFGSINFFKNNEPDWKRKKCKSCNIINSCSVHLYKTKPNHQACEQYKKRK